MDSKQSTHNKKTRRHRFKSRKQQILEKQTRKDDRDSTAGSGYSDIVKANPNFEKYYKAQNIVQSEEEWEQFLEILSHSLPSDFRISSYCAGQAEKMRELIQNDLINCYANNGTEENDKNEELSTDFAVSPIPWYPNNQAWTINLSKVEIRKTIALRKLHKFLISETETGDISRQEAVSMIPPLLLDVQPGHSVLDMCAAPGSKTAQIIEMLHQASSMDFIVDSDGNSLQDKQLLNGLVVANDVDNKRCYMLIHQSNRLHSPCVVITNHDASTMPNFYKTDKDNQKSLLKFDRVLADVPCTGDGTVRKNYDVWTKWNAANSNNFHNLQLKIAKRGLELLAKDGIMSYSTCSLNPAEDEAVIATLLNLSQGGLELIDAPSILPKLKCRPGLETWTVMSRDNQVFSSFAEVPENMHTHIRESLFPPANVAELNLKNCIRVLPHYQNTGGFFIAILRKKVDNMPWEGVDNEKADNNGLSLVDNSNSQDSGQDDRRKKKKGLYFGHREDPFYFLTENDPDWPTLKTYYNFPDSFSCHQLAHRCTTGKRRNIYYLTELAANFIASNSHIKIITGGSRVFNRVDVNNVKCAMRVTQEGIPTLFPFFVTRLKEYLPDLTNENEESRFNIVDLDKKHFVKLLQQEDIKMDQLDEQVHPKMNKLAHGCCILYLQLDRPSPNQTSKFIVPICAWKGRNSIRAYVARNDRVHLLRLCGVEPETILEPVQENKGPKRHNDEANDDATEEELSDSIEQTDSKKCKLEQTDDSTVEANVA